MTSIKATTIKWHYYTCVYLICHLVDSCAIKWNCIIIKQINDIYESNNIQRALLHFCLPDMPLHRQLCHQVKLHDHQADQWHLRMLCKEWRERCFVPRELCFWWLDGQHLQTFCQLKIIVENSDSQPLWARVASLINIFEETAVIFSCL